MTEMEKKIAYLLKNYEFDSKACGGEGAEVQCFTLVYSDNSTLDVSDYLAIPLIKFGNVPVRYSNYRWSSINEGIVLTREQRALIDEYRSNYSTKKVLPTDDCIKYLWN